MYQRVLPARSETQTIFPVGSELKVYWEWENDDSPIDLSWRTALGPVVDSRTCAMFRQWYDLVLCGRFVKRTGAVCTEQREQQCHDHSSGGYL